jgi:hypothetical protein
LLYASVVPGATTVGCAEVEAWAGLAEVAAVAEEPMTGVEGAEVFLESAILLASSWTSSMFLVADE